MKKTASIFAILLTVAIGAVAILANEPEPGSSRVLSNPQANAATLYANHCAKCHGADGRGQTKQGKLLNAKDFTNARWKARTTVDEAVAVIREGDGDMPAFAKKLTAAQIRALAEYTLGFPR